MKASRIQAVKWVTAALALPRQLTLSGKYAPNGGGQDDGKDNTADHDHDLLLLIVRRENYMRNGITVQVHILTTRRQAQLDTEEGRRGQETPDGTWMDLACSQKCFQVRLEIRSTGICVLPFFLLAIIPSDPLLPTRASWMTVFFWGTKSHHMVAPNHQSVMQGDGPRAVLQSI